MDIATEEHLLHMVCAVLLKIHEIKKDNFMRKYFAQYLIFKKLSPQTKNSLMSQSKWTNVQSVAQLLARETPDSQFV